MNCSILLMPDAFDPDRWNACVRLLSGPLERLNAVQRTAALVFRYEGSVMNGGHSLYFDTPDYLDASELLQGLKTVKAFAHARIFTNADSLHREAEQVEEDEQMHLAEVIEDLDREFGQIQPPLNDLLCRYFDSHPAHFPG